MRGSFPARASAGLDEGDRRHRELSAEVRGRVERAAGRRGSRRRRQPHARRPRSDRQGRRLDQDVRTTGGVNVRLPADLLG